MEPIESTNKDIIVPTGIENIRITRAFSHSGNLAAPDHVFYKYSFVKTHDRAGKLEHPIKYKSTVQITLAYEKEVGEKAVKEYISEKYIK